MPTDLEDEIFLTEVPIELLTQAIETQFEDPLENRHIDYLQSFINKYTFSKENEHEDNQVLVDQLYSQFIEFMLKIFDEKLDVGFPDIDNEDEFDALEKLQLTYRFFIKNIKKNFVSFICNYIDDNRDEVVSNLELKKDVTSLNFKEEIDNEDDVLILSNLGIVVKDILNKAYNEFDVDNFFEYCRAGEVCLEIEFTKSKYETFEITGNFVPKYIQMILEYRGELESKIRNHILKKYPNRAPKIEPKEEINDINNETEEENIEEIESEDE
jgi:hypothetical protein